MASSRLRERRLLPSRVGANDTLFPCMSGCMYVCVHGWLSMSVCVRLFSLYSARASVCVRLLVFPLLCAGDFKRCMAFNCRSMQCRLFFYFIYISLSLSLCSLFSLFSFLSPLSSLFSLSLSLSCLFDPPLSKVSILTYISSTLSHSNSVHPRLLPNRLSGRGSLEVYVFWCLKQNYQKVEAWTPPIQLIS